MAAVRAINDPDRQSEAKGAVVMALAEAGQLTPGGGLTDSVPLGRLDVAAARTLVVAWVQAGEPHRAETIMAAVDDEFETVPIALAAELARAGDIQRGETVAHSINVPDRRGKHWPPSPRYLPRRAQWRKPAA
jgi:hypothetical protein